MSEWIDFLSIPTRIIGALLVAGLIAAIRLCWKKLKNTNPVTWYKVHDTEWEREIPNTKESMRGSISTYKLINTTNSKQGEIELIIQSEPLEYKLYPPRTSNLEKVHTGAILNIGELKANGEVVVELHGTYDVWILEVRCDEVEMEELYRYKAVKLDALILPSMSIIVNWTMVFATTLIAMVALLDLL